MPRPEAATDADVGLTPLGIDGAWVFTPRIHLDHRGGFLEWFCGGELAAHLGYRPAVAQGNCSVSRRGVLRGIHFADVPPGQAKYVTCVNGVVLDVVVDLRAGSPTFARWEAVLLGRGNRQAVYLAEGLGHAFMALSDEATVTYLCSTPYTPGREHGIHPLDPAVGVDWPADVDVVLSDKDAAAPGLDEALRLGLLPDYGECTRYLASLREAARP